jgi:hypothetical protein
MVTTASSGLVLVLSLLAQQPTPPRIDQSTPGERFEIPSNIQASDDLKDLLTTLAARSRTLREQCARIGAAPQTRILIDVIGHRLGALTRARATARRYDSGLLTVVIELPAVSMGDFAELLAHELEHVIELTDKVDLAEMVRQKSDGVTQNHEGLFETDRAQAAGRAAAAEICSETDPAAAAIGRGVAKVARLAWRGLVGFTGIKNSP